jgi:hypothetical protein
LWNYPGACRDGIYNLILLFNRCPNKLCVGR